MNDERNRSKGFQLFYSAYSLIKLLVVAVLICEMDNCASMLNTYLILYCVTEGYELMFLSLLILNRHYLFMANPSFLIGIGQASYECFRIILTVAMTVELSKNSQCISSGQGILQLVLITIGYLKYVIGCGIVIFYCCLFRRSLVLDEVSPEFKKKDVLDFLNRFKSQWSQEQECPICMDSAQKEGVELECGHKFHNDCLQDWVILKGSCPVCRKKLPVI